MHVIQYLYLKRQIQFKCNFNWNLQLINIVFLAHPKESLWIFCTYDMYTRLHIVCLISLIGSFQYTRNECRAFWSEFVGLFTAESAMSIPAIFVLFDFPHELYSHVGHMMSTLCLCISDSLYSSIGCLIQPTILIQVNQK